MPRAQEAYAYVRDTAVPAAQEGARQAKETYDAVKPHAVEAFHFVRDNYEARAARPAFALRRRSRCLFVVLAACGAGRLGLWLTPEGGGPGRLAQTIKPHAVEAAKFAKENYEARALAPGPARSRLQFFRRSDMMNQPRYFGAAPPSSEGGPPGC